MKASLYFGHWGISLLVDGVIVDTLYYVSNGMGVYEDPKIRAEAEAWRDNFNAVRV